MAVSQAQQNQQKWMRFQMEEAQWIDSIVRPLLPSFVKRPVEALSGTWLGRILHFLVDWIILGNILHLKITRSKHTELGGKGFRGGLQRISTVTVRISKRGKEIASKVFFVNLIFNE